MLQVPSCNGTGLNIEQQSAGKLPASSPFEVKELQLVQVPSLIKRPTPNNLPQGWNLIVTGDNPCQEDLPIQYRSILRQPPKLR